MKKIIGSMLLSIGLLSAGVVSNITQIGDTVEDRTENIASMTQMDAVGGQPYTMPTSTSTATSETTIDLNLDGGGGGDNSSIGVDFSPTNYYSPDGLCKITGGRNTLTFYNNCYGSPKTATFLFQNNTWIKQSGDVCQLYGSSFLFIAYDPSGTYSINIQNNKLVLGAGLGDVLPLNFDLLTSAVTPVTRTTEVIVAETSTIYGATISQTATIDVDKRIYGANNEALCFYSFIPGGQTYYKIKPDLFYTTIVSATTTQYGAIEKCPIKFNWIK